MAKLWGEGVTQQNISDARIDCLLLAAAIAPRLLTMEVRSLFIAKQQYGITLIDLMTFNSNVIPTPTRQECYSLCGVDFLLHKASENVLLTICFLKPVIRYLQLDVT